MAGSTATGATGGTGTLGNGLATCATDGGLTSFLTGEAEFAAVGNGVMAVDVGVGLCVSDAGTDATSVSGALVDLACRSGTVEATGLRSALGLIAAVGAAADGAASAVGKGVSSALVIAVALIPLPSEAKLIDGFELPT